jgi:hypothetical protein
MISFEGGRRRNDEEHQRALEEQWMSGMTGLDEAATAGSSGEGKCLPPPPPPPWSWSSDLGLLFLAARHD